MKQVITLAICFCLILSTLSLYTLRSTKRTKEALTIHFTNYRIFSLDFPITEKVLEEEINQPRGNLSLKIENGILKGVSLQNFKPFNGEEGFWHGLLKKNGSTFLVLLSDNQYIFKIKDDEEDKDNKENIQKLNKMKIDNRIVKKINGIIMQLEQKNKSKPDYSAIKRNEINDARDLRLKKLQEEMDRIREEKKNEVDATKVHYVALYKSNGAHERELAKTEQAISWLREILAIKITPLK
jgi:hypothetical protein